MFANVNRGTLVEECRALEIASGALIVPTQTCAAAAIVRWLADPRAPLDTTQRGPAGDPRSRLARRPLSMDSFP